MFAGSFELSAAERVCAGTDPAGTVPLDGEQVVEALIGLVDKSVVQRIGEDGGRYRLLDTIREYGTARLTGTADAEAVRQRHFAHYDGLVDRFWNGLMGRGQVRLHHAVRAEIADVRAALEYGCATEGRAADALWLATRLGAYWRAAGTLSEGRYWIDKGLGLAPQDSAVRAWGLFMTGVFGVWTADLETALDRFPQALDVARRIGESRVELFSEGYLGALTLLGGAVEEGSAALEAVRVRMIAADDALGIGVVHYEGALLYAALGFTDRALEWCETGLTYLEGRGERQLYGSTLTVQGSSSGSSAVPRRARRRCAGAWRRRARSARCWSPRSRRWAWPGTRPGGSGTSGPAGCWGTPSTRDGWAATRSACSPAAGRTGVPTACGTGGVGRRTVRAMAGGGRPHVGP